jgi:hypothetical protein
VARSGEVITNASVGQFLRDLFGPDVATLRHLGISGVHEVVNADGVTQVVVLPAVEQPDGTLLPAASPDGTAINPRKAAAAAALRGEDFLAPVVEPPRATLEVPWTSASGNHPMAESVEIDATLALDQPITVDEPSVVSAILIEEATPIAGHVTEPTVAPQNRWLQVAWVLLVLTAVGALLGLWSLRENRASPQPLSPGTPLTPIAAAPDVAPAVGGEPLAEPPPPEEPAPQPVELVSGTASPAVDGVDGGLSPQVEAPPAVVDERPRRKRPPRTGKVALRVHPYAEVFYEGRRLGVTPIQPVEVPAGVAQFVLKNKELGITRKVSVKVAGGAEVMLKENLLETRK